MTVGSVVTWTLAYSNPGSAGLLIPAVDDILPTGLQFLSATPAPTYVVPVPGGTRVHWTLPSPLAAGASGSITVRASVQTAAGQPFTNSATFSGTDAANTSYSASASAVVLVSPPEARLDKSVSPSGTVNAGAQLTYTLSPSSPGPDDPQPRSHLRRAAAVHDLRERQREPERHLRSVRAHRRRAGSRPRAGAGDERVHQRGHLAVHGRDWRHRDGDDGADQQRPARGGFPITAVTPSALVPSDAATTCSAPSPPTVASIPVNGGTATITYTCTIGSLGEISFDGGADGTYNGAAYSFAAADFQHGARRRDDDRHQCRHLGTRCSRTAIRRTCRPSRSPRTRARRCSHSTAPPPTWERYSITANAWISSPASLANLPGNVADGGALVYDGLGAADGYVYAFQGGTTAFWRYKISTGARRNVGSGRIGPRGGRCRRRAGGARRHHLCASGQQQRVLEDTTPSINLWTSLAPLPAVAGAGAALASLGPFVYALQGNDTKKFYRYNPATDTLGARCRTTVPATPRPAPGWFRPAA